MARFDRQDTEASKLSTSLDVATGELESFVERTVREILEAAVERAAQIERDATERAQAVQREAERKSGELLEEAYTRAWRILDGIDLLENGVGDMIGALRTEMEAFAADLGSALPAGSNPRELPRPRSSRSLSPAPRDAAGALEEDENARNGHDTNHAEVEQMIIEQVAILFREGRSRADAERFVMRFKQGRDYLHVLDRIYREDSDGPPAPEPSSSSSQRARWGIRGRRG